jgi:hypothetical protein
LPIRGSIFSHSRYYKLEAQNPRLPENLFGGQAKFETNSNIQNRKYFVLKIGKFAIRRLPVESENLSLTFSFSFWIPASAGMTK